MRKANPANKHVASRNVVSARNNVNVNMSKFAAFSLQSSMRITVTDLYTHASEGAKR